MDEFERRLTDALADDASAPNRSAGLATGARRKARRRRGRRRTALGVVAASTLVAAVVGGQWWTEAGQGGDPARGEDETASGPLVTCRDGSSWPVSAMAGPQPLPGDEDTAIRDAFATLLSEAPMDAPPALRASGALRARYVMLDDRANRAVLGVGEWSEQGPGRDAMVVALTRDGATWSVDGWGDCRLHVLTPPGQARVELSAPRGGVDTTSRTLILEATELQCSSGRDVTPYLSKPEVVETDDEVRVILTAAEVTAAATCQGALPVDVTITLDRPLGDRTLLDAGAWPPVALETAQP